MAKTIIQTIGPLYGEVVNGTVFGQPNGSVYVPPDNVIYFTLPSTYIKNALVNGQYRVRFTDSDGSATLAIPGTVAMQDLSSSVRFVLCTSADIEDLVASQNFPAGTTSFNAGNIVNNYQITVGQTYYFAVQIMNNGSVVGSTEFYAVVAV